MHSVSPKKRLGQHFLKDMNIARKIVGSVSCDAGFIIEIGPGTGVLTELLINEKRNFIAVDIDNESIEYLKNRFPNHSEKIIFGDFLKTDISQYNNKNITILGNLPYNISSQIFFRILENKNIVSEVVCMVQKEVAERIVSKPGTKVYGILSVLIQAFYNTEILFSVSEKVFIPPPKVRSAVMHFTRNKRKTLPCDEKLFFEIVKKAFNQRRKILRNSLRGFDVSLLDNDVLLKRPEQLSVEDFVNIALNIKRN